MTCKGITSPWTNDAGQEHILMSRMATYSVLIDQTSVVFLQEVSGEQATSAIGARHLAQ
jgi:hypothetical protein